VDRIPLALYRVFFHDQGGTWLRWHTEKLWALPTEVSTANLADLLWHLELPVWQSGPSTRFDLSPRQVLDAPEEHWAHWQRVLAADPGYPLELFESYGRWVIMDGYHRLARHVIERSHEVVVRYHDQALLPAILRPRHE
jgi:hypothetical protein